MPPLLIGGAIAAASAIGSAKIQSNAAKNAAKEQQKGTDRALQVQQEANAPYMQLGQQAAGRLGQMAQQPQPAPFQGPTGPPSYALGNLGMPPQGQPGMQQPQGQPAPGMEQRPQQPFNLEAFQARATELSKGLKGTNAEFQQILFPQLAQEFAGLERFGSKGDKIRLPGGGVIDAVLSAGLGGKGFQFGLEGPSAPKAPTMQAPAPWTGAPQPSDMIRFADVNSGAAPAPTLGQYSQALQQSAPPQGPPQMFAPQNVQGPQAMKIPGLGNVPMFASGVQDFTGGPAIVGEKGPELVNLPQGSDVIPNGALNFGNGGSLPGIGQAGMTLGAGGAMPAIGQPSGGSINFGNGGGMPQPREWSGQPAAQPGPQAQQGGYQYNPMAGPSNYNPQNIAGPDRLSLGSIGQPNAVNTQQVNAERIGAQGVQMPGQVGFERVQGPQALQAQQLGPAQQQANLSASQLPIDPSYQFRRDESLGALQNSAAAKGMLHHPNTLRGLMDTAGNLASQEYAAANARNLGVQQQNFQNTATVAGANNAANAQAYGLTNQFQQQAALANQGAGLEAGKFNVGTGLQAGMFNAQQGQSADQFNAANAQQAGQFNSGQNQQAQQFNAQMGFNTQQANIGNQLAAYNAYQPLNQQNQQFNAQQQAAANQNNFANAFSVNQANNAGSLGAFNANLGAELGRGNLGVAQGNLALGNRQADQSYELGQGNLALGNRQADQSYDLGRRNNDLGWYGAQNSYSLGLGNLGQGQQQIDLQGQNQAYNQAANTYGINQNTANTQFDQNYRLATLGAGAAGNYGNAAGNAYINQGATNGNAGMAGAGAYAGALGTIGNIAGQAGAYYDPRTQQRGGQ